MAEVTIESLQARLDKAVEVFKQMKAEMAKKDDKIEELQKINEDNTKNILELNKTIDELNNTPKNEFDITVYENLKDDYDKSIAENKVLEAQVKEINSIRSKQLEVYNKLKDEYDSVQSKFDELAELNASLTQDNKKLNDELKELKNKAEEFVDKYTELNDQYTYCKGTLKMTESTNSDLKEQVEELKHRCEELEEINYSLNEDNNSLSSVYDEYETVVNNYNKLQDSLSSLQTPKYTMMNDPRLNPRTDTLYDDPNMTI